MAQITWTNEALRWLEDIFEYIASDNPTAASQTVEGIFDRAQVLAEYPEIGQRFAGSPRNVRILVHEQYRIAYLVKSDSHIDILGVFHSALDITKYQL
jgi:plasmid stabilization system protein ParE